MAKKKAATKKTTAAKKKAATKKAVTKKAPAKKKVAAKKAPSKKTATKKVTKKKVTAKKVATKKAVKSAVKASKPAPKAKRAKAKKPAAVEEESEVSIKPAKKVKMTPFLKKQRERLLILRDSLVDAMAGVARDNLRSRAEGSEASAYGMHQADAGSDAYDRDFALNLLSQEQDALYEIEEALKRVDLGTYGICEMSGKEINKERLEAIPFARFTVECQERFERDSINGNFRRPMNALFGAGGADSDDDREESFDDDKD